MAPDDFPFHSRRLERIVERLLAVEPVVALHGPRSVGKSTLLHVIARRQGLTVIDLDDPAIRQAVTASPVAAVEGPGTVCIDEYQHVPEVLSALKARLNREGSQPGTALITGSTRQDALPRTAESLTGRLAALTIWPLSQGEIEGVQENLLARLLDDPDSAVAALPASATSRWEYADRMCAGGFPLALRRDGADRARWFGNYVTQSIERDVLELVRIRDRRQLRDILDRLAARTASVLDVTKATAGLSGERKTHENYIRLLEDRLVPRAPAARMGHDPRVADGEVAQGACGRLRPRGPSARRHPGQTRT